MIFFTVKVFAADQDSTSQKPLSKELEGILAKAGISFDGEFRSQYLSSQIGDTGASKTRRSFESAEYTSVDFDIKARPNTITQGHLILRMHQDWRNFFSDISNPIDTRWISIDGTLKQMFSYNVGDFKQKYTALTLYSPDVNILYEPEIFKKDGDVAKGERFLEDNQRILQGVNCNFAAEVDPIFNSLQIGVLGSRLRNCQTNLQNGDMPTDVIEDTLMEKFLFASNIDVTFLKSFSLGGNFLTFFDNKASFDDVMISSSKLSDSLGDTMAKSTSVYDIRCGIDIAELLKADSWKASVSAEFAASSDDSAYYHVDSIKGTTVTLRKTVENKYIPGQAFRGGLTAGYTGSDLFSFGLSAYYINTAKEYRNELAQSPSFIGRRIMNIDNDTISSSNNYDVHAPHYSTFDAMYNNVFKFCPMDQTNAFFPAPFSKNSYYGTVFTHGELMQMLARKLMDPSVQLVMPFGPATPNRTGIDTKLNVKILGGKIEAQGVFASLKEITPDTVNLPLTDYSQVGGGAKVNFDKFVKWQYPFYISGSMVRSSAKNEGISGASDSNFVALTTTSDYYCGDFYFKFWKRAALIGGVEMINNDFASTYDNKVDQLYWAGGIEYKVATGSTLTGKIGEIKVSYDNNAPVTAKQPKASNADFSQAIVNLFLSVRF
jgi:hypothetical protein